jgi:GrpB-like predicted nucleotidyltransferase (UPF0157 family)
MKLFNFIKTFKKILAEISLDISLFLKSPVNFLFLFTYPTNRFTSLKPYDSNLQNTADIIIKKINQAAPDLKVNFVGSASLHILGKEDIDLVSGAKHNDFKTYIPILSKLFGNPNKIRNKFAEWFFSYNNIAVELYLTNTSAPAYKHELKIFGILKTNNKLLEEYVTLKKSLDGLSEREYHKRRMPFFHMLLGLDNQ